MRRTVFVVKEAHSHEISPNSSLRVSSPLLIPHRVSYRSGIGTIYHQVRKTDEQDFRIIEFEPNNTVAVKTLPQSSPCFERRFTLYAEGDTTRIRDQWQLDTGRPALLERLARGRVKSAVSENLTKLKELLEAGRVVLQDGRQVVTSRSCRPYAHSSWTEAMHDAGCELPRTPTF